MANVLVDNESLSDIADAIRDKLSVQTTYKPREMAAAIESISGGITPTGTISITQNGTVDVTNYASANVNVSSGGGSGTDVTIATACTNALDCVNQIFPSRVATGHLYVAFLKNKTSSNFETDQLLGLLVFGTSSFGVGVRWRNNGFNTMAGVSSSYDAKIAVGDVYETFDIDYSS